MQVKAAHTPVKLLNLKKSEHQGSDIQENDVFRTWVLCMYALPHLLMVKNLGRTQHLLKRQYFFVIKLILK